MRTAGVVPAATTFATIAGSSTDNEIAAQTSRRQGRSMKDCLGFESRVIRPVPYLFQRPHSGQFSVTVHRQALIPLPFFVVQTFLSAAVVNAGRKTCTTSYLPSARERLQFFVRLEDRRYDKAEAEMCHPWNTSSRDIPSAPMYYPSNRSRAGFHSEAFFVVRPGAPGQSAVVMNAGNPDTSGCTTNY